MYVLTPLSRLAHSPILAVLLPHPCCNTQFQANLFCSLLTSFTLSKVAVLAVPKALLSQTDKDKQRSLSWCSLCTILNRYDILSICHCLCCDLELGWTRRARDNQQFHLLHFKMHLSSSCSTFRLPQSAGSIAILSRLGFVSTHIHMYMHVCMYTNTYLAL